MLFENCDSISTSRRNPTIDVLKGICILFMVGGHSGFPIESFIYLFHMAVFFMASGYCYKESNSEDSDHFLRFVARKLKTLWFPYVLWTLIFSLLHNFFIDINIFTDNPLFLEEVHGKLNHLESLWSGRHILKNVVLSFLMLGNPTQLGGAFWFLNTLFYLSIAYCTIDYVITHLFQEKYHELLQFVVSIIFLAFGFYCYLNSHEYYGFSRVFSYYILFWAGHMMRKAHFLQSLSFYSRIINIILSFLFLIFLMQFGRIRLVSNEYTNPLFLISSSFAGWIFMYEISSIVLNIKILGSLFIFIGQNTLSIVILHFLCFKIVNFIGVIIYNRPIYHVAAFPCLLQDGLWWIAYMFVGVTIPVLCSLLWKKIKRNRTLIANMICR